MHEIEFDTMPCPVIVKSKAINHTIDSPFSMFCSLLMSKYSTSFNFRFLCNNVSVFVHIYSSLFWDYRFVKFFFLRFSTAQNHSGTKLTFWLWNGLSTKPVNDGFWDWEQHPLNYVIKSVLFVGFGCITEVRLMVCSMKSVKHF